ncbi:MAG TPA: YHS domain-containing protein [Ktedonobacterales bacterium]|jgi:Cu+-exporting ATPase|nr:YHS domain-containing protein [Ktedonobacterales bacterium]
METHDTRDDRATLATDPVCGMEVDPATAAATSEYQGKTYYFCAVGCKNRFDKDPQSYIGAQEP